MGERTKALVIVFTLFSLIVIVDVDVSVAQSATLVVPDDYPTIAAAIGNATDGDTVFVKKGIYREKLYIDKPIFLVGEDAQNTIIEGDHSRAVIVVSYGNVTISSFTIKNGVSGSNIYYKALVAIHLLHTSRCNIHNNILVNSGIGVWLYGAYENNITSNKISDNNYGIRIESSNNNIITDNEVSNNSGGILLLSAANNKLRNNVMADNGGSFSVSGNGLSTFSNDVDTSNTINAKPIIYWIDVSDRVVPSDASCVVLVNCLNMKVCNSNFSKTYDGILLAYTHNSIVTNNTITNGNTGIRLYASSNNKIVGNTITCYNGIVTGGNGTQVTNNNIASGNVGITISGFSQTITGNNVTAGTAGTNCDLISCSGSYHNISSNLFRGQTYVGIDVEGSYNLFYDNNIPVGGTMSISGNWNVIAKNNFTDYGIHVSGSRNIVCANSFTDGPTAFSIGSDNSIYCANHIENSRLAVSIGGSDTTVLNNTLYNNNFITIEQLVKNTGDNKANSWDNGFEGNYWSDYTGKDRNSDGVGDTPYSVESEHLDYNLRKMTEYVCGTDNYPFVTPLNILNSSKWVHNFVAGIGEWSKYNVDIVSDSVVSDFVFDPEGLLIQFNVNSVVSKKSFCRLTIPKNLLSANGSWIVLADTHNLEVVVDETAEYSYTYFTYEYGQKTIKIIGTTAIQPLDKTSPTIHIISPQTTTYLTESCTLAFTVDEEVSWMGYSLDCQNNVTITENTLNITGLTDGSHTLVIYANDMSGNMGVSETITFYILSVQTLALVLIVIVMSIVAVGATLRYYRKRRPTRKF